MPEPPCVCVQQATGDDKTVVAGLLQAYLHDMTPFTGDDPDQLTPYAYPYFDLYWSEQGMGEGRIPYLIIADDEIAGFTFVNRHSRLGTTGTWNIAEFYVQESRRREGVGKQAVRQLLTMHPGRWEIAVLRANTPARAFWIAVVDEITGGEFEIVRTDPKVWNGDVISFESRRR